MKKRQFFSIAPIILIVGLFLAFPQFNANDPDSFNPLYRYSTLEFDGSISYDIVKVTPEHIDSLRFYYEDQNDEKFSTISNVKSQKGNIVFATNGGIFSTTYEPLGLYIENGEIVSHINTARGEGNFYLMPNGVFLVKGDRASIIETNAYQDEADIAFALQSGPLLVFEGQMNPIFKEDSHNRYLRSGVGIDAEGNVIFAISNQPVTFYEFASLFQDTLNCDNALYLDGAISEMYVPGHREHTKEKFGVIIEIVDNR